MIETVFKRDVHSYSDPERVRTSHVHLELAVHFAARRLEGSVTLTIGCPMGAREELVLDTKDLSIHRVLVSKDGGSYSDTPFTLGRPDQLLGAPLAIDVPRGASHVRIEYATQPQASGLQWLEPGETADKIHPFLLTQSQAIHARSWIPLQDTPGVRVTFSAVVRTPAPLQAIMGAQSRHVAADDRYEFRMDLPIPSYLFALAVGNIVFASLGPRTGVYAEPGLLADAAHEFEDTELMMSAAERLFGPYRWGRYDLLVLPPSFPLGGMENPCLTFVTPTLIAGDKSLNTLIAHELAHSWSGNLVSAATWGDFWLNEGFTTYIERRIQEELYGVERACMEDVLAFDWLEHELARLAPQDQILHINLEGRDPDENTTRIPYVKGALFLRSLELEFGRPRFDAFLRGYFDHFAFQSVTTERFVDYLESHLLRLDPAHASRVRLHEWIESPGLPQSTPRTVSVAFEGVEKAASDWLRGALSLKEIGARHWSTHELLRFLDVLPDRLELQKMAGLDRVFNFTSSRNTEILYRWLLMAIRNQYEPAYSKLEGFLSTIGRRKFVKPLYEELLRTPAGRERVERLYQRNRSTYHPITRGAIDKLLDGSVPEPRA
ncbi:MAG: M1 family metallopeptidase [Bryobacterales bacterium]|nr:M1 family metallopeptidase [Bryobacterales bacterium]